MRGDQPPKTWITINSKRSILTSPRAPVCVSRNCCFRVQNRGPKLGHHNGDWLSETRHFWAPYCQKMLKFWKFWNLWFFENFGGDSLNDNWCFYKAIFAFFLCLWGGYLRAQNLWFFSWINFGKTRNNENSRFRVFHQNVEIRAAKMATCMAINRQKREL